MYKEEKIIRRTATASERKAIIDFLDSINANPITMAQAEDIKIDNENNYKNATVEKDAIIEILNGYSQICEGRGCDGCIWENNQCCKISTDTLINFVKSL